MLSSHQKLSSQIIPVRGLENFLKFLQFLPQLLYKCQSSVISAYSYFLKVDTYIFVFYFLHFKFSDIKESKCYGYSYTLDLNVVYMTLPHLIFFSI